MRTELPTRDRSDAHIDAEWEYPEVLFEEARRRRRRRWMAGSALVSAAAIAGVLSLGMAGGGGRGSAGTANGQPSGSGSGATSNHAAASRLFPGAPSNQGFYTGPGASCPLARRSRYLPAWSGCVSTTVSDLTGTGRRDLVLTYSRLRHVGLNSPPRLRKFPKRYLAEQAMLRIVSPDGHMITTPIRYRIAPTKTYRRGPEKAYSAGLVSVAHVGGEPGKEIFLQIDHISSGSTVMAYGLYRRHLVSSGALLGYGGDSGAQAGFQCVPGRPPRLIQHTYELLRGIKTVGNTVHIYGWWNVTSVAYTWRGPRLVRLTQQTAKRRILPSDTVGLGCTRGIT